MSWIDSNKAFQQAKDWIISNQTESGKINWDEKR